MHCYTYVLEDWGYKNRLMFFFCCILFSRFFFHSKDTILYQMSVSPTQKVLVPLPKGEQVRLPLGGQVR